MTEWAIWAVLLVLQNAAHTASSRAKNSKSLKYTAIVGVFSNGIWLASQFYIVNQLILAKGNPMRFTLVLGFYIALTVLGTVGSQWYLMRFEEKHGIERG